MNPLCWIEFHKLYIYAKPKESWAKGIRWIKCRRCHRDFAMNDSVKAFLPMDFELLDMHEWERSQADPKHQA